MNDVEAIKAVVGESNFPILVKYTWPDGKETEEAVDAPENIHSGIAFCVLKCNYLPDSQNNDSKPVFSP